MIETPLVPMIMRLIMLMMYSLKASKNIENNHKVWQIIDIS